MGNQEIITKVKDVLYPFETENVVKFVKELSFTTVMGNAWMLGILLVVFFFEII